MGDPSLRRAASTESAVIRPVLGFSEGTFSIDSVKRAQSLSTSMVWQLRSTVGSAQISINVRSGPMPASESAAATLTLAGKPAAASRAVPQKTRFGLVEALDRDAVRLEIGRAGEAARGLAGDHPHGMNRAFGGCGDRIEPKKCAGRHDDLTSPRLRQLDQLRPRQQRAGREHHDPLPRLEHGPANAVEHASGRAFDREIGMGRETPPVRPAGM